MLAGRGGQGKALALAEAARALYAGLEHPRAAESRSEMARWGGGEG